jgi:hypothetical protein
LSQSCKLTFIAYQVDLRAGHNTRKEMVAAKLSIYQAMRARRMTTEDLSRRLGWEAARLRRLLDLRRRSRLEDIEAALEAMGKRLIIEVGNAA